MKLSKIEQEVIINYNAVEDTASAFSSYPPMSKKLIKLAKENGLTILRNSPYETEIELPKSWIRIYPPRKLSEETKKKLAERMRSLNKN